MRVLLLLLMLFPGPALAHKVIASVFPSGDMIEGEIGFSNGDMAVNTLVEVFDGAGNKLGETQTDEEGFFVFAPAGPVDHVFRADLGAGHVAEAVMPAAELPGLTAKKGTTDSETRPQGSGEEAGLSLGEADIARIVRDEMRPLRREITAYKEKNDLQTILGGIGYIIGLFGIGFYLAARRKLNGDG
ncbi:MAG: cobalt ABC transporter permease [Rhodobacterales bacterium]|nr:MAG: cobalt ABC transporter permease [Rhodobacterales bacterium]